MRGERNIARAEQMRACQCSREAISAAIGVDVDAIAAWFAAQDDIVLADEDA